MDNFSEFVKVSEMVWELEVGGKVIYALERQAYLKGLFERERISMPGKNNY